MIKTSDTQRKGLSIEDYNNDILLQLGAPTVDIEVEDQIPKIIEMSFNELKNNITDVRTITIPFQNKIDVSSYKISNIVYIMRGHNTNGPGGFQDVMYIYSRQSAMNTYTYN